MGKFLLYIAIAISVASAALGFLNRNNLVTVKEERDATKSQLASSQEQAKKIAADKKKSDELLQTATAEKDQAAAALTAAIADKDRAAKESTDAKAQLAEANTKLTTLQQDNDAKNTRIAELEAKSQPVVDTSAQDLKPQLLEKEQLLSAAQSKMAEMQASMNQLMEDKQRRMSQKMREGMEGRILAVNPAYNFVVLSLGDRNGVITNSEMLIRRGNQLLGRVRITSVDPSTSIADIVANSVPKGFSVQPGDNVIYRGSEELTN